MIKKGNTYYRVKSSGTWSNIHANAPINDLTFYTIFTVEHFNSAELDELRDYLTGQSSDGFVEGFEQREIRTAEYGNVYVSFWNDSDEWSLLTEEELEQQEMEESMDMRL